MKNYKKPYKIKKKKPLFKKAIFWYVFLFFIAGGFIFYCFCFFPVFQIKEIKIYGANKVSSEEIINVLQAKLTKNILFFNSKSIFLADFQLASKEILENFPQITNIECKRNFPDKVAVKIQERIPVAILAQGDRSFFIDEEGIIFELLSEQKENVMRMTDLTLKENIALGERVINKEDLSRIIAIYNALKTDLNIYFKPFQKVSENRLNVTTLEGWQIFFDFQKDVIWQIDKLKAVLEEKIPSDKRRNLEYIELRFGNLAPYKYR